MTQPNSVNMTFDTSLIDLKPNSSFSTTESDPSDFGTTNPTVQTPTIQQGSLLDDQSQETPKPSQVAPSNMASPPPKSSTPVQHIPTQVAYDQWASIYDSDGNMLQSIDDIELTALLPSFMNSVQESTNTPTISLIDLGCGTGRNTFKLLASPLLPGRSATISGLDFSKGMLSIATSKLHSLNPQFSDKVKFLQCDCFPTVNSPASSPLPSIPNSYLEPANGVISTLVLEHIPLDPYFSTLSALLRPGGYALVTNMHAEMGAKSQAGFVNAQGVKVRGSSFAHTLEETVRAAGEAGFEVVSVREREMRSGDVESGMVGERGWKWVGVRVWFGIVVRRV